MIAPRKPATARNELFANDCWRPPPSTLRRPMYIVTESPAATAAGVQPIVARLFTGRNGLSQLMLDELKKLPPAAICATDS